MRKQGFLHVILGAVSMFSASNACSFTWQNLWVSPDKQAEALMKEGQFSKAGELFQQASWKAAANYRAKNFKQAARQFGTLQSESGYYNQGNALAQMGQYQEAIKAYDKALALNPANQDAIYNRKLVDELLKKNQDKQQDKQQDDKNKQNQQNEKNQQNNSGNQDNQQNDKNQGKPEDKEQQDNKQQSGKDNKDESGKESKENQDQEQQTKEQKAKEQQDKDSKTAEKPDSANKENTDKAGKKQDAAAQTAEEREKQQAKEQWLQLIPDDPGGLMREKFMRDYIRRQRGWQQ